MRLHIPHAGPMGYLLSVDGFNILLDAGWSTRFRTADLEPFAGCVGGRRRVFDFSQPSHCAIAALSVCPCAFPSPLIRSSCAVCVHRSFPHTRARARKHTHTHIHTFTHARTHAQGCRHDQRGLDLPRRHRPHRRPPVPPPQRPWRGMRDAVPRGR